PRAILMEEKHQVVGQARRIVFAMLPGTPFTAVRIEADHADMATGRPDRTVTADDEHAPSRIDASALGSRLGRNLAGFRLDRGDAEVAGKPDRSDLIFGNGFDLDEVRECCGECRGDRVVVVGELARTSIIGFQSVTIGAEPEAAIATF